MCSYKICICNILNISIYKIVVFFLYLFCFVNIYVLGELIFVFIKLSDLKYEFFKFVRKMSLLMIEMYRIF